MMKNRDYPFFLGIDVSKLTLDYSLIQGEKLIAQGKIPNTPTGLKVLKKELKQRKIEASQVLLCCENTGLYSALLLQWGTEEKYDLWLENPITIKRSIGLARGKNDKVDAYRIALYASRHKTQACLWTPPRKAVATLKALISNRTNILKMKKGIEVKLGEAKLAHQKADYQMMQKTYKKILLECVAALQKIEKEIEKTIQEDKKLKEMCQIMRSVEGVGLITAVFLITTSNEFKNITEPRKMACYAGVAPFQYLSGTSVRGKNRVSHLANKPLKAILHMAALSAAHGKGDLAKYYERKVAENKNKMLVLNAIRNKILHRIYACVKDNRMYERNYTRKLA